MPRDKTSLPTTDINAPLSLLITATTLLQQQYTSVGYEYYLVYENNDHHHHYQHGRQPDYLLLQVTVVAGKEVIAVV